MTEKHGYVNTTKTDVVASPKQHKTQNGSMKEARVCSYESITLSYFDTC